jgi:hypothetical protein
MKQTFVNYYCATWLIILEATFKMWKVIMIHCLKMKKIDHKNIQFRQPNLNIIFSNELASELDGQAPFTMEFVREELEKSAKENVEKLNAHRLEVAERAKRAISNKFDASSFKSSRDMVKEYRAMVENGQDILDDTNDPDDRIEEFGGLTGSMIEASMKMLNDTEPDIVFGSIKDTNEWLNSFLGTNEAPMSIQTKLPAIEKNELDLARNTKKVKTAVEKQIKRQVDASNKKAKPAKPKKTNIKKVSKSSK